MESIIPYVFFAGFVAQVLAMTMYRPRNPTTRRWLFLNLNLPPKRSDFLSPIGWWSRLTAFAAITVTLVLAVLTIVFRVG